MSITPYGGRETISVVLDSDTTIWKNKVIAASSTISDNWLTKVDWAIAKLKNTESLVPGQSNWSQIDQLITLCGASSLAGALCSIKGPDPISTNFTAADYNLNFGLQGNTTSYLTLVTNRLRPVQSMVAWTTGGGTATQEIINRAGPLRLRLNGPLTVTPGALYNTFVSGGLPGGPSEGLIGFSRLSNDLVQVINNFGAIQTITNVATTGDQTQLAMEAFRVRGSTATANYFTGKCSLLVVGGAIDLTKVSPILRNMMQQAINL